MRKLKTLWRTALSPRAWEELETWIGVLLALGAAVLLFLTLTGQAAYADELPPMAAGARGTPWHEAYVHAVPAPGMPPTGRTLS